jgi:PIN domain nuclease of toxin-antitoxin system
VALLLDTHAFIWWMANDPKLSRLAYAEIAVGESDVFISAATVWEIATKHRLGKLEVDDDLASSMETAIAKQNFLGLPVTLAHAQRAGALPGPHADPFDRMLIAQAMTEDLTLVSNERPFDLYGVKRLW